MLLLTTAQAKLGIQGIPPFWGSSVKGHCIYLLLLLGPAFKGFLPAQRCQRNPKAAITAITNISHYWPGLIEASDKRQSLNPFFPRLPGSVLQNGIKTTVRLTHSGGIPQPKICLHTSLLVLTVLLLHMPLLSWNIATFPFSFLILGNCPYISCQQISSLSFSSPIAKF